MSSTNAPDHHAVQTSAKEWIHLNEQDRADQADKLRDIMARAIRELGDYDAYKMWAFFEVARASEGNAITPIEDFILDLPFWWKLARERGDGLTPDRIVEMIDEPSDGCRSWFDRAVTTARGFNRYYKNVLDKADAETVSEAL